MYLEDALASSQVRTFYVDHRRCQQIQESIGQLARTAEDSGLLRQAQHDNARAMLEVSCAAPTIGVYR
jgi:hypothetical protein